MLARVFRHSCLFVGVHSIVVCEFICTRISICVDVYLEGKENSISFLTEANREEIVFCAVCHKTGALRVEIRPLFVTLKINVELQDLVANHNRQLVVTI